MISVIVPVFNIEKYVGRCIDSILNQSYMNFELILVDDGSIDSSGSICDEYALKDKRVKVIHKKNGGLSSARNAGLDVAKGEYISLIDGDDFVHRDFLKILYQNAIENNADLVCCDFKRITEKDIVDVKQQKESGAVRLFTNDEAFAARWIIFVMAWNKLYKKRLFETCRYPEGKLHEDEFVFHRLLFQCEVVVHVNAELYYYFCRENSIINTFNTKRISDAVEALEERLKFCIQNDWNNTAYYALDTIGEYAITHYFDFKKNRNIDLQQSKGIYLWYREKVKENKRVKLSIKNRCFYISPYLYNIYIFMENVFFAMKKKKNI